MRFTIFSFVLAALFSVGTMAVAPMHSVIISFDSNTPDSVLQQAKDMVVAAKGVITHEYNIIKGFAAHIPQSAMESIQTMSTEYPALIESDGIVSTQGQ